MNDSSDAAVARDDWQILDRQQSAELIDRLTSHSDADLFSPSNSGVQYRLLPFYRHFVHYRIINYNTMPVFTLDFIGDGTTFYRLDGSPDPLLLVNSRGDLDIDADNTLDYIRFFFSQIETDEGEMMLVDDPDDLPFIDSLDMQQQLMLKQRHEKPEVVYDINTDQFVLSSDVFYTGCLLKADISVDRDGHINVQDRGMIMADTFNNQFSAGLHEGFYE